MLIFEGVTIAYVSGMLAAALLTARLRPAAVGAGLATLTVVGAAASFASDEVRFWMPVVYLLAGYWLPGLLVRADAPPSARFEAWLARVDGQLRRWVPGVPRHVRPAMELAYLFCYPLVPVTFALALVAASSPQLERFWLSVLLSGFLCYAPLPWLLSRPPRVVAGAAAGGHSVQRLNVFVLGRASHGWNTFPSGHVAVAWAAAWSLLHIWPPAGAAVAIVASAISIGAAAGGYHYTIDVVAGWLIAVAVAVITW